jgi:hypothetical protein
MTFHVFLLLLLFCLMFSLARLWHLCWCHHCPAQLRAAARHPTLQRLLKPRSPRDCTTCRLSPTCSSIVEPVPAPPLVRPWREVKSRRGAPKRVNTEGFACPNQQCPYSGITDAHLHASFWGWQAWPGFADPDVSLSGLPHHFQCPAPYPFVPFEKPPPVPGRKGADRARLEGWALPKLGVFSATDKRPSLPGCRAQPLHAQTLHERFFRTLQLPYLQLDELRTRLCSAKQVLWLWLAIDPLTRDFSHALSGSPHAEHGAFAHPLPATALGRLSASHSSPVMG